MRRTLVLEWQAAIALLGLWLSVSSVRAEDPARTREKGDLAIQARAILKDYCAECHSGEPGSRGTIAVFDRPRLVTAGPNPPIPFVKPGDPAGSQIIQFLEDGSMPPVKRPRPTNDQIETLKKWITAGAPGFPRAFNEDYPLQVVLDDFKLQPPETAPFLRYLSLAHLVGEGRPAADLSAIQGRMIAALQACNPGVQSQLVPVDAPATVFRIDIRTLGWDSRELFYRTDQGAEKGLYPALTPYDLILLEYPFASRMAPDHPLASGSNSYLKQAKLPIPIPYLRMDWLADQLAKGSPLADDLKSLVELRQALEKEGFPNLDKEKQLPCGPTPRPFGGRNPVPAAPKPESPSPILPLGSWYSGDCGADPAPFGLKVQAVTGQDVLPKKVKPGTLFQIRVTSTRDAHFKLLKVMGDDGSVVVQETNKGGFFKAGESTILTPPKADAFVIPSAGAELSVYFVLLACPTDLPPVVAVKSRHSEGIGCEEQKRSPVTRFFLDPNAKPDGFDPAQVVRAVVPVTFQKE